MVGMPRYEYQCSECGAVRSHPAFYRCPGDHLPECTGEVHRVIGPVGVVFKGSGFYSTDSKKGSSSSKDD
jgi:putative FmdB family regulatory protein